MTAFGKKFRAVTVTLKNVTIITETAERFLFFYSEKVENSILHLKLQISKKNEEMLALKMSKLQEEKHQLELQLKLLEKSKES